MFCTENCDDVQMQYLTLMQSFVFSNVLRGSTLSNSGVLQCPNKDSPTRLSFLFHLVLPSQPGSNDIIEKCAGVHHGLGLVLADAENQSKIVDMILLQWQQVVSDHNEILLTYKKTIRSQKFHHLTSTG